MNRERREKRRMIKHSSIERETRNEERRFEKRAHRNIHSLSVSKNFIINSKTWKWDNQTAWTTRKYTENTRGKERKEGNQNE